MSKRQPQESNKRKKPSGSSKTLGSLLKYMEGMELIVELKTGKRIQGTLSSADNDMNLEMDQEVPRDSAAIAQNQESEPDNDELDNILSSTIHIRGSNIRCIQFPDNADLKGQIASGMERERAAANKYKRGKRK
eukprot:scaffold3791_cov137-Cylindrotheca_fusiformis.AAC.5